MISWTLVIAKICKDQVASLHRDWEYHTHQNSLVYLNFLIQPKNTEI